MLGVIFPSKGECHMVFLKGFQVVRIRLSKTRTGFVLIVCGKNECDWLRTQFFVLTSPLTKISFSYSICIVDFHISTRITTSCCHLLASSKQHCNNGTSGDAFLTRYELLDAISLFLCFNHTNGPSKQCHDTFSLSALA